MNGDSSESPSWSRQRWAIVVLAIFFLHLGALFIVSSRKELVVHGTDAKAPIRWLTSPDGARKTLDALLLGDPTLLAMASPRGFSGAGWLRPQSPEYRASEWTDTERSLGQPTNSLGGAFRQFATADQAPIFDPARKPQSPQPVEATPQPALRTESRLRVEEPTNRRLIVQPIPLRSWPHVDVLANSRVHVFITDEGLTFSPRLENGGGKVPPQRVADQYALDLAHTIRFEPVAKSVGGRAGQHSEATLVFEWHTIESTVPQTNP